ncbi:glycosyltransferase family A protein [Alteromonas sp. A079]|uniref:glycosyltransferase family A protein n=1 Tax=Alteromonas sp. A079 TaxID=3410268 RepID=UPI003BA05466
MDAKNNNSESFSLLKLAQCAASEKRNKSAGLLYKLAMLAKPHLSYSISRLLETHGIQDDIVNTPFPNLCIIADVKYSDVVNVLLQQIEIFSLEVWKVVLFADASSYESNTIVDEFSSKHVNVEIKDASSSSPLSFWLEHSLKDESRDVLPVFVNREILCEQFPKNDCLQLLAQSLIHPGNQSHAFNSGIAHDVDLSTVANFDLVLTVTSDAVAEETLKSLSLFSKYTGIKVHLVASSAKFIFDSENIMTWLEGEIIERLQASDSDFHFCSDVTEFIKKLNAEKAVILPIELALYATPLLYKLTFHAFDIPTYVSDWFQVVSVKEVQNSGDAQFKYSPLKPSTELVWQKKVSGFITDQAINRLGGVEAFRKHRLAFNGILFSEIDEWWLLGNTNFENTKGFNCFPSEVKSNGKTSLVFDIQPITQEQHPAFRYLPASSINLRRRVITARRLPNIGVTKTSQNALFVMTCFNKEQFIEESVYGVLMQTHPNVKLYVCDDASTDNSLAAAKNILSIVKPNFSFDIYEGKGGEGTYQLRNKIIHQSLNNNSVYFINDADDISCAKRAELQLNQLASPEKLYTFGDITRIDSRGRALTLEGVSERYGTASFAAKTEIHQQYGFYENLQKGADTEFIERMQFYAPSNLGGWWRYPVLFQSFTSDNLTSDIYAITEQGNLVQNISARTKYLELSRERHKKMLKSSLCKVFTYNNLSFPVNYHQNISEFFTSTSNAEILPDVTPELTITSKGLADLGWETLPAKINKDDNSSFLRLMSELEPDQHEYLMVKDTSGSTILNVLQKEDRGLLFKAVGNLGVCFVAIYLNKDGEKLSHQFFWVNQVMPVKIPPECRKVQLGFRIQGKGTCDFEAVEVGEF